MHQFRSYSRLVLFGFALSTLGGCGAAPDSPQNWSVSKVAKFVEDHSGLTKVNLTKGSDGEGEFSGTAVFGDDQLECVVTVEDKRVSWKASSGTVEQVSADGSKSVTRGPTIEGSRAW